MAAAGVGPLGAFFGNHLGGGNAPYWRPLIGTVFGLCASSLLVVGFSKARLWHDVPGGIGISLSALLPVLAQVLATELGVAQDPP